MKNLYSAKKETHSSEAFKKCKVYNEQGEMKYLLTIAYLNFKVSFRF